jgi:hypothetical protein
VTDIETVEPRVGWARRLCESWLRDHERQLTTSANRAQLRSARLEAGQHDTNYMRARRVLQRRLLRAAEVFAAPLTDDEWDREASK